MITDNIHILPSVHEGCFSELNTTMKFVLLVLTLIPVSMGIKCYFKAETKMTQLPSQLLCRCPLFAADSTDTSEWEVLNTQSDIFKAFIPAMVDNIETITIFECENLLLNLTLREDNDMLRNVELTDSPDETVNLKRKLLDLEMTSETARPALKVDVVVQNVTNLKIILPAQVFTDATSDFYVNNLKLQNVTFAETLFGQLATTVLHPNLGILGITKEQLYFYMVIALSALLGLCIFVIIPVIVCCSAQNKKDGCCCCGSGGGVKEPKKVSRADSWRYEPSMYLNPGARAALRANSPHNYNSRHYELVPQQEVMLHSQSEGDYSNVGHLLGRVSQVPMQIGLPNLQQHNSRLCGESVHEESQNEDENLRYIDDTFERDGRRSLNEDDTFKTDSTGSVGYDSRHQTSTLPLPQLMDKPSSTFG